MASSITNGDFHAKSMRKLAACRRTLRGSVRKHTQFLDAKQGMAVETAMSRGKFETNCSAVTPNVLSREVVEPAIGGLRAYGIDRAEYTIGLSGCGDRKTFVVICPEGWDGCFAAGPGRFYGEE